MYRMVVRAAMIGKSAFVTLATVWNEYCIYENVAMVRGRHVILLRTGKAYLRFEMNGNDFSRALQFLRIVHDFERALRFAMIAIEF